MAKAATAQKLGYTITEALAEIKTITKRIETKRNSLTPYLMRNSLAKDPLEKEGGSREFVKRERQAITDLENRIVAIRTAITASNLATTIEVGGVKRSVFEWLTWRRDISQQSLIFLKGITGGIARARDDVKKKGFRTVEREADADMKAQDMIVNIDEKAMLEEIERFETVLGELDGKLSLLNATTVVKI